MLVVERAVDDEGELALLLLLVVGVVGSLGNVRCVGVGDA